MKSYIYHDLSAKESVAAFTENMIYLPKFLLTRPIQQLLR